MIISSYHRNKLDMKTALWVSFWLFILTVGDPDILDVVIGWIGRQ